MDHIILNNGGDSAALAEVALKALREARRSKTSSSGSIFVSDGQTDDDGIALGTGTIINGVDGGIQPWVGDTTPPGKPTGLSVSSKNAAVFVNWDGSMAGGQPVDWGHLQLLAKDDNGNNYDFGILYGAGSQQIADLTPGAKLTVWAIGYDNAHDAQGNSTPNASTPSDNLMVTVESAVDPKDIERAQSDAQSALNQAGQASDTATSAQTAADLALQNSQELLADPTFIQKWGKWKNQNAANANVYFDTNNGNLTLEPNVNVPQYAILVATPNLSGTSPVGYDRTYRISCDVRATGDGTDTIFFVSVAQYMNLQIPTSGLSETDYTHFETDITLKANEVLRTGTIIAIWTPGDAGIGLSNIHVRDITEAKAAQKTADDAKAAAQGARTTADGKNKIFSSASEPSHAGIVPGDMWFQLDSSKNVRGIKVWNGSAFTDMVLLGNKLLVASSVGTTQIADNAIVTGKIAANAITAIKIAAQTITGDKLDVGSVAAAIVTSGLFQTAPSGARVKIDSSGITGYDSKGSITFRIDATTGDVSMIGKFYSGDPSVSRVIIDDDYNNIDDPQYVDIDGYVAFENPLSDVSPFIGGTHGTQTGTEYTGTIVTSGVTDRNTPSASSVQLNSFDGGNGSEGSLLSSMDKSDNGKNAARVGVHSGKDGQMATLLAYDGTENRNYSAVKACVDSNGTHYVDIWATHIFQTDPLTRKKLGEISAVPTVSSTNLTDFFTPASGWSEMYPGECAFIVSNGMAHVTFSLTGTLPVNKYTVVGTLKAGYRPIRPIRISGPIAGGYTYGGWTSTAGVVNIGNRTGADRTWFAVDCTFQLEDLYTS